LGGRPESANKRRRHAETTARKFGVDLGSDEEFEGRAMTLPFLFAAALLCCGPMVIG
jgi:hypothetical protein